VGTAADITTQVVTVLDALGVEYEIIECDPDFADTAAFCEKYGYPVDNCGNAIVVASKREPVQFATCIVKGTSRLDVNKTVRKLMGVPKASFASPEQTVELTGMMIGGVTPFALPPDLPIYADDKLMALDYVILGSGSRSSKVKIVPQVFDVLTNTQIISGLSKTIS
jgi:prolyl-tRNA editing enzyme YbaK/EbsC (Cys-tRNA(Pro) deacylase)